MIGAVVGISVAAVFCVIILVPPFVWHCKNKNIPAICLISWFFYTNITSLINVNIWGGENFTEKWDGKGYCDITTRLGNAYPVGQTCAISALAFNLFMVLRAKNPAFVEKNWKKTVVDLAICLVLPIYVIGISGTVQSSRYIIIRYSGCQGAIQSSKKSLALYSAWNLISAVFALIGASLTLWQYFRMRHDVSDILRCTNTGLNLKRFARLLIFSFLIVLALCPLAIYYFVGDVRLAKYPLQQSPYGWNIISYFDVGFEYCTDIFLTFGLSVITFLLFGTGNDAVSMYKLALRIPWTKKDERDIFMVEGDVQASKVPSKGSQFTASSGYTNASTMRDINNEFGDLLTDKCDSPKSAKNFYDLATIDLEKANTISDTPSSSNASEFNYVLSEPSSQNAFEYTLQIKQNK